MTRDLTDLMHRAVADDEPDLRALAHSARRHGLAIRRRRQAMGLVSAAAIAAVVTGTVQLAPSSTPVERTGDLTVAASPTQGPPTPSKVTVTGRTTAAALVEALQRTGPGRATDPVGQGDGTGTAPESWTGVRWSSTDGRDSERIETNVQPGFDAFEVYGCRQAYQEDCRHEERADGYRMTRYVEHDERRGKVTVRHVVDVLRTDGTRVVVAASQTPTDRGARMLTWADLRTIADDPAFGATMDAEYAEGPVGYTSIDDDITSTPLPSAQPDADD